MTVIALFGSGSANTAFVSFTGTIFVAFFVFILTSTVLYIPAVLVHLKFFRCRIRTIPVKEKLDMVRHLAGFGTVFGCFCIFCCTFISPQRAYG